MSSEEAKHEIWLGCMQRPNCTPVDAVNFVAKALPYLNHSITPSGQTLLMVASSVGSYNIVRQCLLHKAMVDLTDANGRTALHYAASIGNINIFEQLINEGGDPRKESIGGETPLTKACIFCQGDIIEWYLNNELEVFEKEDHFGKKPLEMLKLAGEGLYQEVIQIYRDLRNNEMKE